MCGIAGVGGLPDREKIKGALSRMKKALAHRGPDDEGQWIEDGFGMGMHRLSIIDLPGGHQPMSDKKTGIITVYNGEIYNYRALRGEMEKDGVNFKTSSDTEVVLKGLALKGTGAVHDWNGMFAVACWNQNRKSLTLIRDRVGIKPLYYFWDGTLLIFASEIKAILSSGLFKPRLEKQAVWDYLTFRYVPGQGTIWKNIFKLPPGHILEWSKGSEPRINCYWKTDVLSVSEEGSLDQKLQEFESLFLDSVGQRLLASDVPVGVMLSGGLDSSAIAAAAVEMGHKKFHTFSVGFAEGGEYSELTYARTMAKHIDAEYHEIVIDSDDFLKMLPEAVISADEPLADLTTVPLLAVSRLARENVKVVLSGEGSDEILAGYDFDNYARRVDMMKKINSFNPLILKTALKAMSLFPGKYGAVSKKISNVPVSKWNETLGLHITKHWNQAEKRSLWPSFEGLDSGRVLAGLYADAGSQEPLDQILSVYQRSWMVEDLLMKADKMSMAASLELRVPFLDHRLVQWANSQPLELKVGGSKGSQYITKKILRHFAEKRLPAEIINRPKKGFPVPAYSWLRKEGVYNWAAECLTGSESRLKKIFSQKQMKNNLDLARRGNVDAAHKTWLLAVFELWLRGYDADVS